MGVLPELLNLLSGSIYNKYSHWQKIILLGVLPVSKNKSIGSTPKTFKSALWECYNVYNKHFHWQKICLPGVLQETKNKSTGSAPRVSSGSNISRIYIMSRSLPVYKISFFGNTPGSTIPLLREYSRKRGPTLCSFNTGVLPEALHHFCGSTPAKVVYLALTGVLLQTLNK